MPRWPYPLWIAHRGAGTLAPENTLAAFRVGAGFGYRAFECDVKLSADGVPFLLHDATLERTTSGRGAASARPWIDLSRLDAGGWHSAAFAGEPPASLEQIAAFCRRNRCALNLELKPSPRQDVLTGRAVAQEAARLWSGQRTVPLLSSFSTAALQGARDGAAALPRALLLDRLGAHWFDAMRELDCAAGVFDHTLVDAALVARVHQAQRRVLVYTVNHARAAQRLIALGVDGIITDRVQRLGPASPTPARGSRARAGAAQLR
jgi:glycerophosphoryl diester phosphodiesterase